MRQFSSTVFILLKTRGVLSRNFGYLYFTEVIIFAADFLLLLLTFSRNDLYLIFLT